MIEILIFSTALAAFIQATRLLMGQKAVLKELRKNNELMEMYDIRHEVHRTRTIQDRDTFFTNVFENIEAGGGGDRQ